MDFLSMSMAIIIDASLDYRFHMSDMESFKITCNTANWYLVDIPVLLMQGAGSYNSFPPLDSLLL